MVEKSLDLEIIDAITKLSSWLRSESFRNSLGSLRIKRAIYYYKHKAICELERADKLSNIKHIRTTAICHDCWGTGSYIGEYDHCWKCRNRGWLFLDFIEMTLPTGAVWHTPYDKAPLSLCQKTTYILHLAPQQWSVKQLGKDMPITKVAEALNLVEPWAWGEKWPKFYEIKQYYDRNNYDYWYYKFPLGNRPRTCEFCGKEMTGKPMRYHEHNILLEWFTWMCDSCEAQWRLACGDGPHKWPPFSKQEPEELTGAESIQKWHERRKDWTVYKAKDDGGIPF